MWSLKEESERCVPADSFNLAGDEEVFREMAVTIKELSEDDKIRLQCEARFFYECDMASTRAEGFDEGVKQEKMRSEERIKQEKLRNEKKIKELEAEIARLRKA